MKKLLLLLAITPFLAGCFNTLLGAGIGALASRGNPARGAAIGGLIGLAVDGEVSRQQALAIRDANAPSAAYLQGRADAEAQREEARRQYEYQRGLSSGGGSNHYRTYRRLYYPPNYGWGYGWRHW